MVERRVFISSVSEMRADDARETFRVELLRRILQTIGAERHCEGAVALSLGLPLLLVMDSGVALEGVLAPENRRVIANLPASVEDAEFARAFEGWLREIRGRRDIFLG
jgi:hypothetical protein